MKRWLSLLLLLLLASTASAGVKFARESLNTSTGTQAIELAAGSGTPTAALFIVGSATATATATAELQMSIGCADGTTQWVLNGTDEDNQTTTDNGRRMETDQVIQVVTPGSNSIVGEASFSSFTTDTVTINITDAFESAFFVTVIAFMDTAGADCVLFTANSTQNLTTDVATMAFQADVLFTFTGGVDTDEGETTDFFVSMGIALSSGTQMSQGFGAQHTVTTTDVRSYIDTTRASQFINANGSQSSAIEYGSFDSTGFTATTRDSDSPAACTTGCEIGVLALKWQAGFSQALAQINSPTSTSTDTVTFPGFEPTFALMLTGDAAALNTQNTNGEAFGISATHATDRYSNGWFDDDGLILGGGTNSNTGHISQNTWVRVQRGDATAIFQCTFGSFTSTGWTQTCATTDTGTTRRWIAYALKEATPTVATVRRQPIRIE